MHGKTVNIYAVYEINFWDCGYDGYPTLEKNLFCTVTLVSNVDIDKCKYSGYGIEFNRRRASSVANRFVRNVISFGVDMSSSFMLITRKKVF